MELLVIVAIAVAAIAWFLWKDRQFEQSESHPLDGPTKVPEPWPFPTSRPNEGAGKGALPVMPILTSTLDVNKDGKVDAQDALEAVKKAKEKTKKAAAKIKETVKKAAPKKPAAKKPAAKKASRSKSK